MKMKTENLRNQSISILGAVTLLIAAYYFDRWQAFLTKNFSQTFDRYYIYARLWSVPVAALLFVMGWLLIYHFYKKHVHRGVAILFLIVGNFLLFYPSIALTFGIIGKVGISVEYFGKGVYYYSSAFVSVMGMIGILKPLQNRLLREAVGDKQ